MKQIIDREKILAQLERPGAASLAGARMNLGRFCLRTFRVEEGLCQFYRFTLTDVSVARIIILIDEMTPINAVDRFEETYGHMKIAQSLFGWIGE